MPIKIRNQKPAVLYNDPFSVLPDINPTRDTMDFEDRLENHLRKHYVEPMFVPINAQHPVNITDTDQHGNVHNIDPDTLQAAINHAWTASTLDVDLQEQLSEVYRQGIQYHAPNDWYFEEQLLVEALTRMKLPVPSKRSGKIVQYSASVDVIPAAKQHLSQNDAMSAINWFANIAAFVRDRPFSNYMLLTVQTSDVFDDIKSQLKQMIGVWNTTHTITQDVNKLLADFDKISLATDLSTCLFLPNGGLASATEQDSLSFSRILTNVFSQYEKNNHGALLVQPNNLSQIYTPENIIIINLENYAHANPKDIVKDWDQYEKALAAKKSLNYVSNKKLMTAKAINQSLSGGGKASSSTPKQGVARIKAKHFAGKPIPAKEMLRMMAFVIKSQITQKQTHNTYKTVKSSYMRPNRRKPDDINMPGKISSIQYRPDIHIYMDTSGSISERNYRDAVTNMIMLAKQINCNLFITSFSDYVSQTSLLKTKDKSTAEIYQQFQNIPKVTGGTDFENVWRKIDIIDQYNEKNNKSHQINFVITDFGYSLSNNKRWDRDQASLKHTYYVPISADQRTWDAMRRWAKEFAREMNKAGDYTIRKRILM